MPGKFGVADSGGLLSLSFPGPTPNPSLQTGRGVMGCMIHTFFADIYGMASLGVLIRQKLKLLLRFLIKGRIHFLGMQSLKYISPFY